MVRAVLLNAEIARAGYSKATLCLVATKLKKS